LDTSHVTATLSPTFHTVVWLGLVIGGFHTSRVINGPPKANEANVKNKRMAKLKPNIAEKVEEKDSSLR